ncbi:hypothetical protein BX616_004692 [Lobosporangium transversale]|uniref:Arrestin C-terminal-like domain-containing protein n=1 Tax=Lobosporangium transversale TaxID=64571 RepID=A0A1Y2GYJ2_9FUNG|nr:hypothetical protein BCR41DRAFT_419140 [Lobosporangium transversale]KAF9897962.1 hypothetical protein BX616_004692 [Lobosporangium transversale]ORZ27335.1 hypothetical protein BCR41DRAFT_419140 [Lobosporangium transversale]|eukprot:XP_021885062.1 hypothetical protein BCR41DRAFT_419140 [Lobosporangium transversale]
MTKSMQIHLEGAFIGQTNDPKGEKRLMFPWTGTQGPLIKGKLIVNHKDDLTLKALTLTFTAKISCSWSEKHGSHTTYYSAKRPLLEEKTWVFLEKTDSKGHVLKGNQNYVYDFQLALPVNLPNSLTMSTGKIEYRFSANGKRSTFQLDLYADQIIEIYQSLPPTHPHCIYPNQHTANFENALDYVVQIPSKAFHHGSTVPVTVRMNPLPGMGARWYVKEMNMKVKEYFWFISPGKGVKEEKRTLVENKQGKGTWPTQAASLERVVSITLPAHNIMTTIDTDIIKCTHKLKILFTIDVNGSSKKLVADFDIYIPGPFPPGQGSTGAVQSPPVALPAQNTPAAITGTITGPIAGPIAAGAGAGAGAAGVHMNQPYTHPQQQAHPHYQQQQQQQPHYQQQQQAHYQQQQQAHYQQQQQQQQQQQPPVPQHLQYPPAQPPVHHQQQQHQQQYPSMQPVAPHQQSPSAQQPYPAPLQTPTSAYAQPSPFSIPQTPHHTQPIGYPAPMASTPGSTSGMVSAPIPHPYSQGYPTPKTSHHYPMVTSSQGYPTPAVPPMPSPTAGPAYPMPPSPAQGYAQTSSAAGAPSPGLTHIPMPVPSPVSSAAQPFTPTGASSHPKTPVMSFQQYASSPMPGVDSPKVGNGQPSGSTFAHPGGLRVDDTIKVNVNFDETIKVNLDDIKVPSTPSTPAASVGGKVHSKNPQQRDSFNDSFNNGYTSPGSGTANAASEAHSFVPLPPQPHGPHAVKEPDTDHSQFSYHPPPPPRTSSTTTAIDPSTPTSTTTTHGVNPYAAAAAAVAASASASASASSQQHDLSHQFSQMGFTSPPPPLPSTPTPASSPPTAATSMSTTNGFGIGVSNNAPPITAPKPPPSPLVRPQPPSQTNSSTSSSYPLSPVSAAAIGAVVANQQPYQSPPITQTTQQYQQQQQQQQQLQQQQQQQQQQLHQQQLQHQQQPQPPRKQQVWIPFYHTYAGKTYVQYHPA